MAPSFLVEDVVLIAGRGTLYVTTLDRECDDFDWLVGKTAFLDGKQHRILAVERFCHSPPYRIGEKIGLLAEALVDAKPVDVGNSLFARLPARFQWTLHNILGHPLSEILFQLGFTSLSNWIHDWTIPLHNPMEGGRG